MTDFKKRYEPQNIDDIIFNDDSTKERIKQLAKNGCSKTVLLYGENGVGKSLIANIISTTYFRNAPKDNFYQAKYYPDNKYNDSVIKPKLNSVEMNSIKYRSIIIERVHYYNAEWQEDFLAASSCIPNSRLCICTTNNIKKIDVRILAICELVEIPTPKPERWLERVKYIIEQEGFEAPNNADLIDLIKLGEGNGRHIMHAIEDIYFED